MKYESPLIKIDALKENGKISFNVYSANHNAPITLPKADEPEILYYGVDNSLYQLLTEIDVLLPITEENKYDSLISIIKSNSSQLGLEAEADILKTLTGNAESSMYKYSKTISMRKELPDGISEEEDKEAVFEYLLMLRCEIYNMLLFGEFADMSEQSEFISWYEKYGGLLELENVNEKYYEYFEESYKTSKYFSILKAESMSFGNEDDLRARLFEAAALTAVANGNAASVEEIFNIFKNEITIYVSLTPVKKANVFSKMSGNTYSSFDKLSDAYHTIAGGNSNPPSGPSSNDNDRNTIRVNPGIISQGTQSQSQAEKFTDMETAAWAKEAVYALNKKGIVSGRTENTFEPNANITRAEFIKLLVNLKSGVQQGTEQIFSDVKSGTWYYDYVNTAYLNGYTTGHSDGTFGPDDNITRQDMAVLIYRYLSSPQTDIQLMQFSDNEAISDYAKEAVSYLYGKKVISGMGDGTFSPTQNATRAQAAQMIYKIMS